MHFLFCVEIDYFITFLIIKTGYLRGGGNFIRFVINLINPMLISFLSLKRLTKHHFNLRI